MSPVIYFSLGSNIPPKLIHLKEGLKSIQEHGITVTKLSSVYRTSPVELTNQAYFLNAVAEGKTELSPIEVLRLFKRVEKQWGRGRGVRFGSRTLDLDLLLYGDRRGMSTKILTLPHPRLLARKFVLVPLLEIAPDLKSMDGTPYKVWLLQTDPSQSIQRYRKHWARVL